MTLLVELSAVRVVGTGLLGTSVGLALSAGGRRIWLSDPSPTALTLARDRGAGEVDGEVLGDDPQLVVVCAPPDVTAEVVAAELNRWPRAIVTEVASVKRAVTDRLRELAPAQLARYVGSHPMAGSERSGPAAGRGDLFEGKTWVLCPLPETSTDALECVAELAHLCGAVTMLMSADDHDETVAAVSHLPHIAASLVAARLQDLPEPGVLLSGQGVRDVTRIAAGDPALWTQILAGNAPAILPVAEQLAVDLARMIEALRGLAIRGEDECRARGQIADILLGGRNGQARIPGNHGERHAAGNRVVVTIPDMQRSLARLFRDVEEARVNIQDIRVEHVRGKSLGMVELTVLPASVGILMTCLARYGWKLHV